MRNTGKIVRRTLLVAGILGLAFASYIFGLGTGATDHGMVRIREQRVEVPVEVVKVVTQIVEIERIVTPTPTPEPATLADEFGCQWIMDTYRTLGTMNRDTGFQQVSIAMANKRQRDQSGPRTWVGTGDAAAAVRGCEAQGFK